MRLLPLPDRLRLLLDGGEATMLDQLITQLTELLHSHSTTTLDPDPLFASLEIGGSEDTPHDPALARLFPDAYEQPEDAGDFRRVTEQSLINRKLHDAMVVTEAIGVRAEDAEAATVEVDITHATLPAWVRTLTALRLAIAARIGLEQDADHDLLLADDDLRGTVLVYDWLAAILESILALLASTAEESGEDADSGEDLADNAAADADNEGTSDNADGDSDSDTDSGTDTTRN